MVDPMLYVLIGLRTTGPEDVRWRNLCACLRALALQDLPRDRFRVVVIEQDAEARHADLADRPGVWRYIFDRHGGPYNAARAFNLGALHAGVGAVIATLGADFLVPPDYLRRGLDGIAAGRRALYPFRYIKYLTEDATRAAIDDMTTRPAYWARTTKDYYHGTLYAQSPGGIWTTTELYHALGGHDESFEGWGWEDSEFLTRVARVTQVARMAGHALHAWHPPEDSNGLRAQANYARYQNLNRARRPGARYSAR